jgi:hypothetical protein
MTRAVVTPGICDKYATVEVIKVGKRGVRIEIASDCEMVSKMAKSLVGLDQWDALKPHVESSIYKSASSCRLHTSCPVPMAVLKAIEIEAGLALPQPVLVYFETVE